VLILYSIKNIVTNQCKKFITKRFKKINVGLEKNQQINSNVPLRPTVARLGGGAQGWVNNKSIYLLIFLGLKH